MHTTSSPNERKRSPGKGLSVLVAAVVVCFGLAIVSSSATAAPKTQVVAPGNNGTLKIHEQGTPSGTENNDPKVCVFNVEAFNLDSGQTGYLSFDVQGGDGPTGTPAGPYAFGPADANGYFASQYFNLDPGHYKATLYGKQLPSGELTDVKAKSKVFKVTCGTSESSGPPSTSGAPSTNPVTTPVTTPATTPASTPATSASTTVTDNPCDFVSPAPASCSPTTHTSGPPVAPSNPPTTFTGGNNPPINGGATGPTSLAGNDIGLSSGTIASFVVVLMLLGFSFGVRYRRQHRGARE